MANTALNRTMVALLTNKSGGAVAQGDVIIVDSANAAAFTTTTTSAYIDGSVGVVLEPNGIANNASGTVAFGGYVPLVNLSSSASLGDLFHTHSVAKQALRHAAPVVNGDFGQVLGIGTTPAAFLWGTPEVAAAGGSLTLAGDSDVSLSSPANNDLLAYVTGAGKWENLTMAALGLAGSCAAVAQQSTATSIANGSYAKMQLDGASILHGGATIDNTGMTGNGIKPGTAGTYLIAGNISSTSNTGTFLQIGWGLNGTLQHLAMGGTNAGQNGGAVVDVATLGSTDVVNLMGQAGSAQNSYPAGTRLIVVRLF